MKTFFSQMKFQKIYIYTVHKTVGTKILKINVFVALRVGEIFD